MLANCGQLGLDPASLSLSGYIEALAAHNATADGSKPAPTKEETERLRRFFGAHKDDHGGDS